MVDSSMQRQAGMEQLLNEQGTAFNTSAVAAEAKRRIWHAGMIGGVRAAKNAAKEFKAELKAFADNSGGFVQLGPVLTVVGTVLTVIIVVLVLAALAPEFFQAAADITGALTTADLNNTLANTIAGIVAILVPLVLLFAFVALIFRAAKGGGDGGY